MGKSTKKKNKKVTAPKANIQELSISRDGGQIALRGYSYQFLYSCYLILSSSNPSNFFQLEGIEDIDCIMQKNGKVSLGNLTKLLEAKGKLIRKALGISELSIEILEDRVAFPWFEELPNSDAVKAYTHFISALCEMSRNAKQVTANEKSVENEKYAFRCFLLRLGFIGSEYKAERKILLKNLTGSSAFKDGGVNHEVSE